MNHADRNLLFGILDGQRIASGGWDRSVKVWDKGLPASHALSEHGVEFHSKPAELPADPFAR
jgi:hypothetical protein